MTPTTSQNHIPIGAQTEARVLAAAHAVAAGGPFTLADLAPALGSDDRPWMVRAVRALVVYRQLARVPVDRDQALTFRPVRALHRIISGDTVYGAGTDLGDVQDTAKRLYLGHVADVWTEWQRRCGAWSLVAVDDDAEENADGSCDAYYTGIRVVTIDLDRPAEPAAQPEPDRRPFAVTQHFDGGGTNEYSPTGQANAEALVAAGARSGIPTMAVLDFIAAEKC
jgi:hypothetical protein